MAGPVYYRADFARAARPFPAHYNGKLFIYEWMRGWIIAVTMNANGSLASMERFMPSTKFNNPIDMEFGRTGDLYLLEYGTAWFTGNDDARLVRIAYTAGNRTPTVAAGVDTPAGAAPLRVALSSSGTADADEDSLRYAWKITRANGTLERRLSGRSPTITLPTAGVYTATLFVTDAKGARDSANVRIAVGNQPPNVQVDLPESNRSFFFPGVPVRYAVRVTDREDGSLESGRIPAARVVVTAEYVKDGVAKDSVPSSTSATAHEAGQKLIASGNCLSCHQIDRKSIGPAYTAVAQRYKADRSAMARLVAKVRGGGSGVWGGATMPPHSEFSEAEISQMVSYILSLADEKKATPSLSTRGAYTPPAVPDSTPPGVGLVVLRAEYADRGANGVPAVSARKTVVLRSPHVIAASGEFAEGVQKYKGPETPIEVAIGSRNGAYVGFRQLDLTGVSAIVFAALAPAPQLNSLGGTVEVRLDSASGPLVGETAVLQPSATMGAATQLRAALTPTAGPRDVYFVFRNASATPGRNLFILTTATFEHAP
jgi:cytochrome c